MVAIRLLAQKLLGIERKPGIDTVGFHALGDRFNQRIGIRMRLASLAINKKRNRHTPIALPRDTPLRAVADHGSHSLLAPARKPVNAAKRFKGFLTNTTGIQIQKPLRCRPKQNGRFMAPAMRITMLIGCVVDERPGLLQTLNNLPIRIEDKLPGKFPANESPIITHRILQRQLIPLTNNEVISTVTRRGMHGTCTGLNGDMLAQNDRHFAREERMTQAEPLQRLALTTTDNAVMLNTKPRQCGFV